MASKTVRIYFSDFTGKEIGNADDVAELLLKKKEARYRIPAECA